MNTNEKIIVNDDFDAENAILFQDFAEVEIDLDGLI